jgi:putative ABC transport system permease protein
MRLALRRLWILFAALVCFLLIACSNVAGLVLVRSSERRFELAVRMALGAGKWRIARQVLVEVLLLAMGGGVGGLAIGRVGIALLVRYGPSAPPQFEAPVFWFYAGLSVLTILLCGLYPALDSAGAASISGSFSAAGYQHTPGLVMHRWQRGLTVAQVAVATGLLACGGLLVHSLERLLQTPLGFDPRGVITMQISLPPLRYASPESRTHFFEVLLEQISALPDCKGHPGVRCFPSGTARMSMCLRLSASPRSPSPPWQTITLYLPATSKLCAFRCFAGACLLRKTTRGPCQ